MAIEKRGKNKYYYRNERVGTKVISIYCGKMGPNNPAYEEDRIKRELREVQRGFREIERERNRELSILLKNLHQQTQESISKSFIAHGFKNHKGEWRKTRNG